MSLGRKCRVRVREEPARSLAVVELWADGEVWHPRTVLRSSIVPSTLLTYH